MLSLSCNKKCLVRVNHVFWYLIFSMFLIAQNALSVISGVLLPIVITGCGSTIFWASADKKPYYRPVVAVIQVRKEEWNGAVNHAHSWKAYKLDNHARIFSASSIMYSSVYYRFVTRYTWPLYCTRVSYMTRQLDYVVLFSKLSFYSKIKYSFVNIFHSEKTLVFDRVYKWVYI